MNRRLEALRRRMSLAPISGITRAVEIDERDGRHREPDQAGSVAGAQSVAYRAGSQKARLLNAYIEAYPEALTDEEAAVRAGLTANRTCCWWKRCGELRQDGYIEQTDEMRRGSAGVARLTSVFLPEGVE